jgi:hypothetical protein
LIEKVLFGVLIMIIFYIVVEKIYILSQCKLDKNKFSGRLMMEFV